MKHIFLKQFSENIRKKYTDTKMTQNMSFNIPPKKRRNKPIKYIIQYHVPKMEKNKALDSKFRGEK